MQKLDSKKKYSGFTFEDFLQDDFFISSMKNPNEESTGFWKDLLDENNINREEFYSAKFFIESIESNCNESVNDAELSVLWAGINITNKTDKIPDRSNLRKLLYIGGCVAACIIFIIIALPFFHGNNHSPDNDIMLYAQKNRIQGENNTDIRIVLSDRKVLQLSDTESDIVYDSTGIKVSKESISKKESAIYNQLLVPRGKRSKLTLTDGTMMYVNSGTRVIYPIEFTEDKREIYVDGEIFINVAPDSKRPFIVKTKDMNVQVLGTSFNVMAYESDINKQIVLVKGSVKICDKTKEIMLSPSQIYEVESGEEAFVSAVDVSKYISWINGLYQFESEKLEIVLLRLSRYYGTDIIFSKDAGNLKCSGKMDLKDDLKDILDGLSFSFPIKVQYDKNKYNITRN
ncbi:MAG: FecR domain-containing protein [Prevotella sp.]|jgi:hypothetical protein|nr:FecR domain-containing protein [Prevotella sp.]MDR2005274.1 FecR domain-containing protein [Prevotella sp.]